MEQRKRLQKKSPVRVQKDTSNQKYGDTDNHSFQKREKQNAEKGSIHLVWWKFVFFAAGSERHLLWTTEMPFIVNRGTTLIIERERPLFLLPRSASTSLATSWSERGLQVKAAEGTACLATSFLGKWLPFSGERKRKSPYSDSNRLSLFLRASRAWLLFIFIYTIFSV